MSELELRSGLQIGPHKLRGRFFLAPLAGVSDRPFRALCRGLGAALTYTEMVSAHGLLHGSAQTASYLDREPSEVPFAVQIFAAEPNVLARGAQEAVALGAEIIDINMACPVKKVCGSGAGAAMARDPATVENVVGIVSRSVNVPVTVKIRSGWDDKQKNAVAVARAAEAGGAAGVALHGRTRVQGYSGKADWELIAKVKAAIRVPVFGSGDVWSAADAERMRLETGCDAVLVARGACGNPWIFRELAAAERGEPIPAPPDRGEWTEMVMRHLHLQVAHRRRQPRWVDDPAGAEQSAVREMRKHLIWYTRGRRGGVRLRREIVGASTVSDVERMLAAHFATSDAFVLEPGFVAEHDIGVE